jgi:hypothetical protein
LKRLREQDDFLHAVKARVTGAALIAIVTPAGHSAL